MSKLDRRAFLAGTATFAATLPALRTHALAQAAAPTGPFKLDTFNVGSETVLVRNDDYKWASPLSTSLTPSVPETLLTPSSPTSPVVVPVITAASLAPVRVTVMSCSVPSALVTVTASLAVSPSRRPWTASEPASRV